MGVMACNRNKCENVMCDHSSWEHGYICRECLKELEDGGFQDIGDFMSSPKKKTTNSEAWKNYLSEVFTLQD